MIRFKKSPGQILVVSLLFLLILAALGGVLISAVLTYFQHGKLAYASERALQLAEAGIDKAIYEINQSATYTGETDTALGDGQFTVVVTSVGAKKVIESTGYIPNSVNPQAQKTVRVELATTTAGAAFVYGVQVGYGGAEMGNNSSILGSVYSNGSIFGSPGAAITGDAWIAGGVAPNPDQQQTLQTGEMNVGDASFRTDAAQSFVPSQTQVVSRVSLFVKKTANPSNATVRIVTNSGGSPSGVSLASGTLNSSSVGGSYGWIDVSMSTNPALNAGQTYWMVLDMPSFNSSRYYTWAKHDNSGYGNGVGKYSNSWSASPAVWNDADGDFAFKIWMGGGVTKLSGVNVGVDVHANTIEDSAVGRDAYYQTITNSTVAGASYPGSADPPTLDMPISDAVVEDFKISAASGGTIIPPGGTYIIDGVAENLGPVKIAGNLNIINGAVVNITGPVWVEGDILIENNVLVKLDSAFGSDSAMIIADYPADRYLKGKIIVRNNAQVNGSGDPDSYLMLLSTFADLNFYALDVYNNTAGAIFYSTQGIIHVNNNVALKEVVAYKLSLSNNAIVTYESGLANVLFSAGPTGGWILKKGSWRVISP